MPPAPGLASITIGWPRSCETRSRTTRLTVSDALPAANGLMTLIGRVGQSSACATDAANRSTAHRAPVDGRSDTNRTSQTLWIEHRRLPGESQPKLIAEVSARIKQGGQSAARCQKHNCQQGVRRTTREHAESASKNSPNPPRVEVLVSYGFSSLGLSP